MGIYEAVKDGVKLVQQSDNVELMKVLMNIQTQAYDLLNENQRLKEEILELKNMNKKAENIYLKGDAYFLKSENGKDDGPFCTRCWDKDKLLIRCRVYTEAYTEALKCCCPECNSDGEMIDEKI